MEEKEIDLNNENDILERFDFNYCYDSEKCSRELCMFFNDISMTNRRNFDKRQAFIDLGKIAITLKRQDKRIKELEEFNQHLRERIGRQYDKIVALEKSYNLEKEFGDKMRLENKQLKLQLRKKH